MAPVETLSDMSVRTGDIVRDAATYEALVTSFNLAPDSEWYGVDVAMIRHRAEALGVSDAQVLEPKALLAEIEAIYYAECIARFGIPLATYVPTEGGWGEIVLAHQRQVVDIQADQIRMQTARALQLNKFLATWEEIHEEMQRLGL